ncbi:MAG: outer membrane lipoprotein-sorting protein [Bacteroidota bacterium]
MKRYFILSLLFLSTAVQAQTADEIIQKSEMLLKGKTSQGTYEMIIVTPEYTRTMKMEYLWDDANDRSLIKTIAPKKEAGNKWLKIGSEMWNYLKATETTIKIPPSMMLQSWNGSDFSNDDLARESSVADDYTHSMIGVEEINGEACWKIASTPTADAAVVWGRLYSWVRQKDYLPSIIQYFDEKGKLMRYMVYSDYKVMDGRMMPSKWSMYNKVKPGNRTEFIIDKVDFDTPIPERVFSFRELERGN